jgi:hypothetical protein
MKLPTFLSRNTNNSKLSQHFLALQIGKRHSKAAIWTNKGKEVEIETIVNGLTPEEVIRKALESFPVRHVLFGLSEDYVSDDKIKDDKLLQLKRIAEAFSLAPLGFVVVPEAIAHLLESEQESPPTAIFVGITTDALKIILFRVGKLTKTISVARTGTIVQDLENGLAQFTEEEVLPSKIIIDNEDVALTNLKEELLNYSWQENEKFLHVPKIELLPWEYSIEAVVQAGVSEMGDVNIQEPVQETKKVVEEVVEEEVGDEFAVQPTAQESAESLGFSSSEPLTAVSHEEITVPPQHEEPVVQEKPKFALPSFSFSKLPTVHFPSLASLPRPRGLVPVGIVILIMTLSFGIAVYEYPQTTIKLLAEPEIIEDEVTINLDTSASDINISEGEVPGKVHSVTVSSSKTSEATGKKTIGEKATGKITIYNKSTSAKTFGKGTILSTSSITFSLDEEIKVASASDTGESLDYGKASGKVTAVKIGPQGNIEGGVELTIEDTPVSSAIAKSDEKFSGGTEREISVVSEEDQEGLVLGTTSEIQEKAREQLSSQIGPDEKYLEESMAENVVEKTFDAEPGEETDLVTLDLVLEVSQTSFKVDDINRFLKEYMQKQMKEGYTLNAEKSFFKVIDSEEDEDGNVTFSANYHAFLVPDVSLDGFKEQVAGASTQKLESLVKEFTDNHIIGYEITKTRSLPFLGSRLPFSKNNIQVEIEVYE